MPHEGNTDMRFTIVALAAFRLRVLFGSNVDPDNIPRCNLEGDTLQEGSPDANGGRQEWSNKL